MKQLAYICWFAAFGLLCVYPVISFFFVPTMGAAVLAGIIFVSIGLFSSLNGGFFFRIHKEKSIRSSFLYGLSIGILSALAVFAATAVALAIPRSRSDPHSFEVPPPRFYSLYLLYAVLVTLLVVNIYFMAKVIFRSKSKIKLPSVNRDPSSAVD